MPRMWPNHPPRGAVVLDAESHVSLRLSRHRLRHDESMAEGTMKRAGPKCRCLPDDPVAFLCRECQEFIRRSYARSVVGFEAAAKTFDIDDDVEAMLVGRVGE